jgi:PleD family two-component response regulator
MNFHYDLSGLNILLVDDNGHMRLVVKSILNSLGVRNIRDAGEAVAAFKEMATFEADIIIVSWLMETISGPEFVKLVRTAKDSPNPYVPIVMLSAFTETYRVNEARDAGINEFLAKPLSPKSLYQRIVSIIEKPRPFVRTKDFLGPCRRRRDLGPPKGRPDRRQADPTPVDENTNKLNAVSPG